MPKFTTAERIAFDRVFLATRHAIEDAVYQIKRAINYTGNAQKLWQLGLERDSLEAQKAAMEAEYDALTENSFGVTAPTDEQIADAEALATRVAALTSQRERVSDAVKFAREAVGLYASLKA